MSKMPDFQFGPVQRVNIDAAFEGVRQIGAEQQKVFQAVAEGVDSLAKARIETQMKRAAVNAKVGNAKIREEIEQNPIISTQFLRDRLGDDELAKLPEEVRRQVFRLIPTPDGMEPRDRDDIPMYAVAGLLYDKQSQKVVEGAAQGIDIPGWQTAFRDGIKEHVAEQKLAVNQVAFRQAKAVHAAEDLTMADELTNAGDFAGARQMINSSRFIDPDDKVKHSAMIDKAEQTQPIYDAITKGKISEMPGLIVALERGEGYDKLDQKERAGLVGHLKNAIDEFNNEARRAEERAQRAYDESSWRDINDVTQRGGIPSMKMIWSKPGPGGRLISEDTRKAQIDYIRNLQKAWRDDRKSGPETDWKKYYALEQLAADPEGQKKFLSLDLFTVARPYLGDVEFKRLSDIQADLRKNGPEGSLASRHSGLANEINTKMEARGFDPKDERGRNLYLAVQSAVNRLPKETTPEQLSDAIDRALALEAPKVKGLISDSYKTPLLDMGVPPQATPYWRETFQNLGIRSDDPKRMEQEFSHFQENLPAIREIWARTNPGTEPSSKDEARIWLLFKRDEVDIAAQAGIDPSSSDYLYSTAEDYKPKRAADRIEKEQRSRKILQTVTEAVARGL